MQETVRFNNFKVDASSSRRFIGIPVLLLFAIPLLSQQQQASREANFYSLEKEAALGSSLADDYRLRVPSVNDGDLRAYVSKVAARLNEFAQSPFPFTIEISGGTDPKLETAGLPGGYLFVPLKLLASAADEAELTEPVAHAIAHIVTRQATRLATRGQAANLSTVPLIFIGGWEHGHADASKVVPQGFRKIQVGIEAEAVRLSAEWRGRSGFADGTFNTGEFEGMRERARALVLAAPKNAPPPSLRKQQR